MPLPEDKDNDMKAGSCPNIEGTEPEVKSSCSQDEVDEAFHSVSHETEVNSPEDETKILLDSEDEMKVTLTDLPTEVFLQICSYLNARQLMQTLRLVSKRLNQILSDDFIWRSRIYKRWRQVYPPIPADRECVNWKSACVNLEEQQERWSNMQSSMKHLSFNDVHVASIDAIMLMNKGALCVSGSRDRQLGVWNVTTSSPRLLTIREAHKGWIWGLAAKSDSSFYTCSWDYSTKLWTLDEGRLSASDTLKYKAPMLCVACGPDILAVGTYDKRVMMWDPRAGPEPIRSYVAHRRSVLKLCLLEASGSTDTVVSISEDQTLAVWDIRAGKLLKKNVKIGASDPENSSFPMCMSYNSDNLYIGDSKNRLHLVDPRRNSPTSFELIASYDAGHRDLCRITAIRHALDCIITGSSDGNIRVSTATHQPELITSFSTVGKEVASLDFQHGILAVGCTNCAVELWVPDQENT